MKKVIITLTAAVLLTFGCVNKELQITPITGNGIYQMGSVENPSCIEFQYYVIANYENMPHDSLYRILNTFINSQTPYHSIVNNVTDNPFCFLSAFFYKKSLFANYEKYIRDAIYSETGGISEHRDKLVAQIYALGNEDKHKRIVFNTVFYNKDDIIFLKKDTMNFKN